MAEYIATSINLEKGLHQRLKRAAGQSSMSLIVAKLAEKWLNREVKIEIEPLEDDVSEEECTD